MAEVQLTNVDSSPIYTPELATRRLLSAHRLLAVTVDYSAGNANDGNPDTFFLSKPGVGVYWRGDLKQKTGEEFQVSQVKLTNAAAPAPANTFSAYRVVIESKDGDKICGVTDAVVANGQQVIVNCGVAPNYLSGTKIRVETTDYRGLQLAEVNIVGTDGSDDAKDKAIKSNAGEPCTQQGFNSCYNARARARHNDYREGHQWALPTLTITPPLEGDDEKAKVLQGWLKAKAYTTTDRAVILADLKKDTPADCSSNLYIEAIEANIDKLERNHAATDSWYLNGFPFYDEATSAVKDIATADENLKALDFTRMVWKSTTKVSFAIDGRYVIAWYCDVKGNALNNPQGSNEAAEDWKVRKAA